MHGTDDQKESWVESYLKKEVEQPARGGLCLKLKGPKGWPDRTVFWWNGTLDLIETKRPKGGRFEPLQQRWHVKLRQRGFNVWVINTREQVDEYIRVRQGSFRRSKISLRQACGQDDS